MSPWQRIPPFISKNVYDTSGAGDWFTAGFLNALFKKKINLDIGLQEESIVECINEAKKMAKICCSAIGAQGAFYNSDLSEKIKKGMPPINTSYPLLDDIIYEKDGERCPTCLLKY